MKEATDWQTLWSKVVVTIARVSLKHVYQRNMNDDKFSEAAHLSQEKRNSK